MALNVAKLGAGLADWAAGTVTFTFADGHNIFPATPGMPVKR
jgi:hypothetical protein